MKKTPVSRRGFVKQTAALGLGLMASSLLSKASVLNLEASETAFKLPALGFDYKALEPHIDALTMEIHHSKHHQGYVNKLNKALASVDSTKIEGAAKLDKTKLASIFEHIAHLPTGVRNNAGGHYNHSLYWETMSPKGGGKPRGKLATMIDADFGSFDAFKEAFFKASKTRFGSGWAWLIEKDGKLHITSTANQDNPLMHVPEVEMNGNPILGLDVWEHAYYLKNQNRRGDYINSWFNVVNWDAAAARLSY